MSDLSIDWNPISKLLEKLIKQKITSEKLVKSGKLLNSIEVKSDGNGNFSVIAEDYFKFLDSEHKISESVLNSDEFTDFVQEEIARQIQLSL